MRETTGIPCSERGMSLFLEFNKEGNLTTGSTVESLLDTHPILKFAQTCYNILCWRRMLIRMSILMCDSRLLCTTVEYMYHERDLALLLANVQEMHNVLATHSQCDLSHRWQKHILGNLRIFSRCPRAPALVDWLYLSWWRRRQNLLRRHLQLCKAYRWCVCKAYRWCVHGVLETQLVLLMMISCSAGRYQVGVCNNQSLTLGPTMIYTVSDRLHTGKTVETATCSIV